MKWLGDNRHEGGSSFKPIDRISQPELKDTWLRLIPGPPRLVVHLGRMWRWPRRRTTRVRITDNQGINRHCSSLKTSRKWTSLLKTWLPNQTQTTAFPTRRMRGILLPTMVPWSNVITVQTFLNWEPRRGSKNWGSIWGSTTYVLRKCSFFSVTDYKTVQSSTGRASVPVRSLWAWIHLINCPHDSFLEAHWNRQLRVWHSELFRSILNAHSAPATWEDLPENWRKLALLICPVSPAVENRSVRNHAELMTSTSWLCISTPLLRILLILSDLLHLYSLVDYSSVTTYYYSSPIHHFVPHPCKIVIISSR